MSDLKTIRTSSPTRSADNFPYFEGALPGLAETTDLVLVVGDAKLPVHSYVLTSNSSVLLSAVRATCNSTPLSKELPLPGDSRADTVVALKYLYARRPEIVTVEDAVALSKFAHKYSISHMNTECSTYLVSHAPIMLPESAIFDWTLLAEHNDLKGFLAHCERSITVHFKELQCAEDGKLFSLSKSSLRRIMLGLCAQHDVREVNAIERERGSVCKGCKTANVNLNGKCACGLTLHSSYSIAKVDPSFLQVVLNKFCQVPPAESFLAWQN